MLNAKADPPAEALAKAGLVKWYNETFPKFSWEFDSPIPHKNMSQK